MYSFFLSHSSDVYRTYTSIYTHNQRIDLIIIHVICEQLKCNATKRSTEITYAVLLNNEEALAEAKQLLD